MSWITLFYIFTAALMMSLVMVPPVSHLAVRFGGVDKPDERKVHCSDTPRLGGIAIFSAFLFSVLFFVDIDRQTKAFLAGALVIFLTGMADDLTGLSPRSKMIGEIFAATLVVVSGGVSMTTLGNPLCIGEICLGYLSIPFTIFAVVGVINAINLIDGLDGLAGGTSAVACLAIGVLSWEAGNEKLLALVVALLGAIVGFLRYNTYPARIFMGDSGSLFLGYCMAIFSILLLNKSATPVSPVAPLMILGVPILDTLVVMGGRLLNGKRVSSPDKTHIHHRLLGLGFGHRFSVLVVYGLSYILAAGALLFHGTPDWVQAVLLVAFCLSLYAGLKALASSSFSRNFRLLKSNRALRETTAYRNIVNYSQVLLVIMKYLLLSTLGLVIFVIPIYPRLIAWCVGLLLTCITALLMVGSRWGNAMLQSVIYFSGLIGIFIIENYGRQTEIAGCSLIWVSHILFVLLFAVVGVKIILRKRAGHLITTPFEYLILFVVVAVPLLPTDITASFHLMSVAAKSVIIFVAYKLILMRQARRNRKILAATFLALLALLIRYVSVQ